MESVIKKELFGSEISFILDEVDETISGDIVEEAFEEGLRLQKIFNFYDEKSELSLLNRKRKLSVSDELLEVLKMALEMGKRTRGKYDITLGKQFRQRKLGSEVEKINCSYKDVKIKGNNVELMNEDVLIDLGSIAKGYITDKMAEILINNGVVSGLIDSREI
jgi:thiamine biosynthesis lipoprotein